MSYERITYPNFSSIKPIPLKKGYRKIKKRANYRYDALNRITGAVDDTNNYNLNNITYDKMGNIMSLSRNGWQNTSNFTNMDNLVYTYETNSNKLKKVLDNGNDNYGFKDVVNQAIEYTYDTNGNLLTDANKGITSISYNHLNMPTEIKFNNSNTQKINYTYTADGIKIKKVVNDNGNVTTTDYAGAYHYTNGQLEFIRNIEDGYIYKKADGSFAYAYYYTDQLDNIRLLYSDADGNGTVSQSEIIKEAHFYPFGLKLEGFNTTVQPIGSSFHKYDYQNQERQDELNLNWIQFKYRMLDPAIGRFVSIDPLAESYVHNSTYAFAENKVIKFNELEGLEITLNKFDRLSYDNQNAQGKVGTFAVNSLISIANGAIDIFNYAGDLDRADQSGQGSLNKLASDTGDTASAISSYAENTTLSEFGSDVSTALSKVETYENITGSVIAAGVISKVSKLGSINKAPKASPNVQKALNTLDEIKADGGQVKMNNLKPNQELNMTVSQGSNKLNVRVETHPVPKKYGGNGKTPQRHMNVETVPAKKNKLPNKGHKILEDQ